jgi:hypothetical protein
MVFSIYADFTKQMNDVRLFRLEDEQAFSEFNGN